MFKPNEIPIKIGNIKLFYTRKKCKIAITNQKRIYIFDSKENEFFTTPFSIKDISDITYFRRRGVIIYSNKRIEIIRFLIKKRKSWESLFSSLY